MKWLSVKMESIVMAWIDSRSCISKQEKRFLDLGFKRTVKLDSI